MGNTAGRTQANVSTPSARLSYSGVSVPHESRVGMRAPLRGASHSEWRHDARNTADHRPSDEACVLARTRTAGMHCTSAMWLCTVLDRCHHPQ